MKKVTIITFISVLLITGCKKITVDFTYSPAEPKAGEIVTFSNQSTAGESWLWTFGDNATSLLKHPNKIYKKPGEYKVTLMVDSAKNQTKSTIITIYDTIPTFTCSTDSVLHYHDVTFTTNIYNPFKHPLTFNWNLPEDCEIIAGTRNSKAITVYFKTSGNKNIQLTITQKDNTFNIQKEIVVHQTKAPAIVMRNTDKTVVRQRIISDRIEQISQANSEDVYLLEQTSDTMVVFNDKTFYASQLATTIVGFAGLDIKHMQIDAMTQKWYITTADGLFVANMDGSSLVEIDPTATGAVYVDADRNRIYWATTQGLFAMPLIKSRNNQFTTTPVYYNNLTTIDLITVNNKPQ